MSKRANETSILIDKKPYSLNLTIGGNTYSAPILFTLKNENDSEQIELLIPVSIPVDILFLKENDSLAPPYIQPFQAGKEYNSITFDLSKKAPIASKSEVKGSSERVEAPQKEVFKAFYQQLYKLNFQTQKEKKELLHHLQHYGMSQGGMPINDLPQYRIPFFLSKKPNIVFAVFLGILIVASVIMLGVVAPPIAAGAIATTAAIIELAVGSVVTAFSLAGFISAIKNIVNDGEVSSLGEPTVGTVNATTNLGSTSTATPAHVAPISKEKIVQYPGIGSDTLNPPKPKVTSKKATTNKEERKKPISAAATVSKGEAQPEKVNRTSNGADQIPPAGHDKREENSTVSFTTGKGVKQENGDVVYKGKWASTTTPPKVEDEAHPENTDASLGHSRKSPTFGTSKRTEKKSDLEEDLEVFANERKANPSSHSQFKHLPQKQKKELEETVSFNHPNI